jgi:hypothetical protein
MPLKSPSPLPSPARGEGGIFRNFHWLLFDVWFLVIGYYLVFGFW